MTHKPHPIPERPLPIDYADLSRLAWNELGRRDRYEVERYVPIGGAGEQEIGR